MSAPIHNDKHIAPPQDSPLKSRKRTHDIVAAVSNKHGDASGDLDTAEVDQTLTLAGADPPDQKRSRSAEWRAEGTRISGAADQPRIDRSEEFISSSQKRDSSSSGRPSKFLEGSMNDRASNKPPSRYIKDDQAMDRYVSHEHDERSKGFTHHPNHSISHSSAGTESSKESGIFRFGKAFASAFNPMNIWQGLNGRHKDTQERGDHPPTELLQQRQAKAEKAYAELKKSGFQGMQGIAKDHGDIGTANIEAIGSTVHRDSGVDIDGYRSSTEPKLDEHFSVDDDYLMPPPPIHGFGRSATPTSEVTSEKRSSRHLRTPSLQSLKKAKSYFQFPSTTNQSDSLLPSLALDRNKSSHDVTTKKVMTKQPSRKDLEKQQKLGKKVSDLESKLDLARRQLLLAMNDEDSAPPYPSGKKAFKPGALPPLPSGVVSQQQEIDQDDKPAVTKPQTEATKSLDAALAAFETRGARNGVGSGAKSGEGGTSFAARTAAKAEKQKASMPKKPATRKRKSGGGANDDDVRYKPSTEEDDEVEWQAAKTRPKNKKLMRAKKSQKLESDGKDASKESLLTPALGEDMAPNAGSQGDDTNSVEPEKIDQAKMVSLRTEVQPGVPFGRFSEDFTNLRKEYPGLPDEELVRYVASLIQEQRYVRKEESKDLKVKTSLDPLIEEKENTETGEQEGERQSQQRPPNMSPRKGLRKIHSERTLTRFTSVAHPNQPPPAFLGRPRSTSPLKQDAKSRTRLISPPPTSSYVEQAVSIDEAVTVTPAKDKNIPPVPKVPKIHEDDVSPAKRGGDVEKPLPRLRKEEYDWPEDVF